MKKPRLTQLRNQNQKYQSKYAADVFCGNYMYNNSKGGVTRATKLLQLAIKSDFNAW